MSDILKKRLVIYGSGNFIDIDTIDGSTICDGVHKDCARRLAAAWNAFDGVRTEFIEAMIGTGAMQSASDSMSALPAALSELTAARALLREALDTIEEFPDEDHEIADRIKSYLDACDTLEGK